MIPAAGQTPTNGFQKSWGPVTPSVPLRWAGWNSKQEKKPQFGSSGSNATVNKFLLPTFQKLTEVFLWSYIGVDLTCLWIPRITNSLLTGAVPYDPRQDPKAKDLPFPKQAARWASGNIEGLNWKNLYEETKREIASGPGILAIPALVFIGARQILKKRPLELSYPALEGLGQGFQQHLENHSPIQNADDYAQSLGHYIDSIFTDSALKSTHLNSVISTEELDTLRKTLERVLHHPATLSAKEIEDLQRHPALEGLLTREPKLTNDLRKLLTSGTEASSDLRQHLTQRPLLQLLSEPNAAERTYGDYLKHWSQVWAETAMSSTSNGGRSLRQARLQLLHDDLQDALKTFNLKHRQEAHHIKAIEGDIAGHLFDEQPLHHINTAWLRYTPSQWMPSSGKVVGKGSQQVGLTQFTNDLERWADFAQGAWHRSFKKPGVDLPKVVDALRKRVIIQKLALAIGATALAGLYMIHLAFWAQNYGSYQANRLLKEKPLAPPDSWTGGVTG
jgi:hypothetical protein